MIRPLHRLTAILVLAASAAVVTGCAGGTPEAAPTTVETPSAPTETAAPEPEETSGGDAGSASEDPTCETIISSATIDDFESLGWTSLADVFRAGSVEIQEGVQCVWGDFTTATDHVQIFGWAPITPDQAATAEADLVADGWRREDSPEGVYITESADTAVATDESGYGLTYLFGDGWVKYADTKQGLLLVQFPPS